MSRIVDVEPLDCLAWKDGEHGTTFDDGVLWVLEKIGELPSAQPEKRTEEHTETHACDCISRQAAIDYVDCGHLRPPTELAWSDLDVVNMLKQLPSAEPERKTGKWNRLMMYLADLQLTYAPVDGHGDEVLYSFVSQLIEILEEWDEGNEHESD